MFTHALVRVPCENFASGLTTSGRLGAPDYNLMLRQHDAYVDALRSLGLTVITLPPENDFPDAHFVEDTAVVVPEVAVITNPGAPARRGEERTVAPTLGRYKRLARIEAPGTLDGGDVLLVDRRFFVGLSERTNAEGARQFTEIMTARGYAVDTVPVGQGLHFKSGVNHLGGRTLLATPDFAGLPVLAGYDVLVTPAGEDYAANTLYVNGTLLTPAGFPGVRRLLDGLGLPVVELDMSETRKMDGGLTCLSLRFADQPGTGGA
ncbi:arginine deiminase-related protein [Desulfocurvus sp.]|jgi:dimethylargininase|uniref:dimethylarginine dimethylaminohydrolase family protein n=1 Tax=Desulfocurvus sp. TaxID=2871698 RepID=UPI0025C3D373|nr:arginine deiminase-related protein [Desulfocurvus sp.]MCK9239484.1 arginine deiminase-related protein [Desulfocurvus sp.]